jgi:hypothetical protein
MMPIDNNPPRLFEDPGVSAGLRADMGIAAEASVEGFDYAGGLAGIKTALATEAAGSASAAGSTMTTKVLVGILLASGAAALWGGTREVQSAEPFAVMGPTIGRLAGGNRTVVAPEPPVRFVLANQQGGPGHSSSDEPVPEPASIVSADAPPAKTPRPAKHEPPPEATSNAADFLREAKLVAKARGALRGHPSEALRLTREAAEAFPRGQLVEEREAVAIRALALLGRNEQAKTRAQAFLRLYSDGPHADAVRRAIDAP